MLLYQSSVNRSKLGLSRSVTLQRTWNRAIGIATATPLSRPLYLHRMLKCILMHVYYHARDLNLVMSESATIAIDPANSAKCLKTLRVLFSKPQRVHEVFESTRKEHGIPLHSLKRVKTVRQTSQEMCFAAVLVCSSKTTTSSWQWSIARSFDGSKRSEASALISKAMCSSHINLFQRDFWAYWKTTSMLNINNYFSLMRIRFIQEDVITPEVARSR